MAEQAPTPEILPMIPEELKETDQWVNWVYEDDRKIPVNPRTGGHAMTNESSTWNTFEKAVERGSKYNLGMGFVLTENDPYTVIDLDHCLGKGGVKTEPAISIVDMFRGHAYIEASPSRTGLHIWTRNEIPVNHRTQGLEIYSYGRWMTISGYVNPRAPHIDEIPDGTEQIQAILATYFPKPVQREYTPQPVTLDDEQIWDRLFHSKSGAVFQSLFRGDLGVVHGDHSRGVIFLANMFAQMTNCDPVRMKALLYQTRLVNEKWESRRANRTWIDYQIEDAILYVSGHKKNR